MLNLCKVTKKTGLGGNKRKWKINCMDVIKGLEEEFKNQLLSIYSFFNSLLHVSQHEIPTSVIETHGEISAHTYFSFIHYF